MWNKRELKRDERDLAGYVPDKSRVISRNKSLGRERLRVTTLTRLIALGTPTLK